MLISVFIVFVGALNLFIAAFIDAIFINCTHTRVFVIKKCNLFDFGLTKAAAKTTFLLFDAFFQNCHYLKKILPSP